jgi:hypothetical protein
MLPQNGPAAERKAHEPEPEFAIPVDNLARAYSPTLATAQKAHPGPHDEYEQGCPCELLNTSAHRYHFYRQGQAL